MAEKHGGDPITTYPDPGMSPSKYIALACSSVPKSPPTKKKRGQDVLPNFTKKYDDNRKEKYIRSAKKK